MEEEIKKSPFSEMLFDQIRNRKYYCKRNICTFERRPKDCFCITIKDNEVVPVAGLERGRGHDIGVNFDVNGIPPEQWYSSSIFWHQRIAPWRRFIISVLRKYKLPNCNININAFDHPIPGVLNFCRFKGQKNCFLLPSFRFTYGNGICLDDNWEKGCCPTFKETTEYLQSYHDKYPFNEKINKIYTATDAGQRLDYFLYALEHDFCTGWMYITPWHGWRGLDKQNPKLTRELEKRNLAGPKHKHYCEHFKYKYILYNDGNTLSVRTKLLLNTNSVIISKESPYEEFYSYLLKNNENLIMYKKQEDLQNIYINLEYNTDLCKKIINNNRNFIKEILTYDNILEYMYLLIKYVVAYDN